MIKLLEKEILGGGSHYISGSKVKKLFNDSSKTILLEEMKGIREGEKFTDLAKKRMAEGHKQEPVILKQYEIINSTELIKKWNTLVDDELKISGTFDAIHINKESQLIKVIDAKNSIHGDKEEYMLSWYEYQIRLYMFLAKQYYNSLNEYLDFDVCGSLFARNSKTGEFHETLVHYSKDKEDKMLKRIKSFWEDFNNIEFKKDLDEKKIKNYLKNNKIVKENMDEIKMLKENNQNIFKELGKLPAICYNDNFIVKDFIRQRTIFNKVKWLKYCKENNIDTKQFNKTTKVKVNEIKIR